MKRKVKILIGITTIALLISACSNNNETSSSVNEENPDSHAESTEGEEITITVMDSYAPEDPHGQLVYDYADKFMNENPDINVEIQAIASNDIYTKIAAMASSPDDLPTVFWTSADQIPTLVDLGLTEDMSKWLSEDAINNLDSGALEASMLNGEMTYYPVSLQPQAIIYRKDKFEENNIEIPNSWDEFIEDSKKLTFDNDGDGASDEWGFSMVGSNNSSGQSRFMSYLWSNGFDLVSQDSSGTWITDIESSPEFIEVFSKWTDMNNVDGVVPIGITEVDYPTAASYFAMEYTNMFMSGPNALGIAYSSNPELEGKLGSFELPGDYPGTMLGAEGYSISNNANDEQKAAAAKYLEFFTDNDDDMEFWKLSGKIPSTKTGQNVEYITGDDYAGYLQQIEDGCLPTNPFPGMNGLKSALGDAYSSVFSNEMTNEEAVDKLVRDVDELLLDYN